MAQLPDPVTDNSELNSDKNVAETILAILASLYGDGFFKTADLFRKYVSGDERAVDVVGALQALTHRRGRFENAIALGQALGVLVDREVWVDGTKMRLCRGPRVASVTTWQVAGAANSNAKRPKTAQEGTQRGGGDPQHGKGSRGLKTHPIDLGIQTCTTRLQIGAKLIALALGTHSQRGGANCGEDGGGPHRAARAAGPAPGASPAAASDALPPAWNGPIDCKPSWHGVCEVCHTKLNGRVFWLGAASGHRACHIAKGYK